MNLSGLATLVMLPWPDMDDRWSFDVRAEWDLWTRTPMATDVVTREWFVEFARSVGDASVAFCDSCDDVIDGDRESYITLHDGDTRCETCQDDVSPCPHCDEWFDTGDMTTVDDGSLVCDRRCLNMYYTWCESCDEYRADNDSDHYHDDDDDCDCESAVQSFTFPVNGGTDTITHDSEHNVTMPPGIISSDGLDAVASILYSVQAYAAVGLMTSEVGDEWKTDGGTFPKRLARAMHKAGQQKLDAETLGKIGTTAREYTANDASWRVSVTRDLNQSADDFYHSDSCWWGDYSESRCALKTNGGIGLRTWRTTPYGGWSQVTGRAWVLPVNVDAAGRITPTYDTSARAFLVFNGYGDLEGFDAPRIVATMTGGSIRRVRLSISPMYVNSYSGYLVASPDILDQVTSESNYVGISVSQHGHHADAY
jgi:hypothetical protein